MSRNADLKVAAAGRELLAAKNAEIERLTEELAISAQAVGVSHWRRDECLRLQAEIERLRAALAEVIDALKKLPADGWSDGPYLLEKCQKALAFGYDPRKDC